MADCKRCDRCGICYEESDTFKKSIPRITDTKIKGFEQLFAYALGGNTINFGKVDFQANSGSWISPIDLCHECGKELYEWLTNVVHVEEENNGKSRTKKEKEKA